MSKSVASSSTRQIANIGLQRNDENSDSNMVLAELMSAGKEFSRVAQRHRERLEQLHILKDQAIMSAMEASARTKAVGEQNKMQTEVDALRKQLDEKQRELSRTRNDYVSLQKSVRDVETKSKFERDVLRHEIAQQSQYDMMVTVVIT